MANALYDKGRQSFLEGAINWDTDDIRVILVDTSAYTVDLVNDNALDDVAAGARIATSAALAGTTATDGIADATDIVFTAVTGASVEALVIYKHTGVESTSLLIAYLDTGTNIPFTPNGGDVTIQWSSGANKIFKL
jgi:hypothetical protein